MTHDDELTHLINHGRDREAATLGATPPGPLAQLDAIVPLLLGLVGGLDDEDLDRPTPCDELTVRGVLEHMVGGATTFAAAFRGDPPPAPSPPPSDVVAALPVALADLGAALQAEGALLRTVDSPFGPVSGDFFAGFVALDGLVHGWDIATATGQAYDPPVPVVAAVTSFAREAITDDVRSTGAFAPAVDAEPMASPIVRLVAFTGRA